MKWEAIQLQDWWHKIKYLKYFCSSASSTSTYGILPTYAKLRLRVYQCKDQWSSSEFKASSLATTQNIDDKSIIMGKIPIFYIWDGFLVKFLLQAPLNA